MNLYKEFEILQHLRNNGMCKRLYASFANDVDDGIYYEKQEQDTDTCFQHALNAYFGRPYVAQLQLNGEYCSKLTKFKEQIMKIKSENGNASFYCDLEVIPKENEL